MTQTGHFAWAVDLPKWSIFKMVSFLEYWLSFSAFFAQNNLIVLVDSFSAYFWRKNFLTQTGHFAWAIDLSKWSIFFKWFHFSNIGCFFQRFFAHNILIVLVDSFSAYFWRKTFLTQTAHFAWAIDLPKWSIFKMVLFLKYWLFFLAVFCTEQLNCSCRFIFGIFLEKKFFHPNCPFCMGYSLTKMVDFQSGLISRILAIFSSGFLHRTT